MSVETSTPRSRRAVLAAALGGLGAVIASRISTPDAVRATDGDIVHQGDSLTGTTATTITTAATANAIVGHSFDGVGIWGTSDDTTASTFLVDPSHRTGVVGVAGSGAGMNTVTDEVGIYGFADVSDGSAGVWGDTPNGLGVAGTGFVGVYGTGQWGVLGDVGTTGTGVYGFAGAGAAPNPASGVAVQATAGTTAQVALNVSGKAKFSRSGRARVLAGRSARRINMAGVTTSSYVIATLQTRRTGVYVHAVVPAAGYFTIYLNKTVSAATYIGYLVIN
jgi:hypothetical protein